MQFTSKNIAIVLGAALLMAAAGWGIYAITQPRLPFLEHALYNHPDDLRNIQILGAHQSSLVGIDVSHYQGEIDWNKVKTVYDTHPIRFVFLRATMGIDGKDRSYFKNRQAIRNSSMVGGIYHYYRPNENSTLQAQNFIETVELSRGDFVPILDIEELPTVQSMERLKTGIQNWLDIVENHYGVRPMIYSGHHYYDHYLSDTFSHYPVWIANYNHYISRPLLNWKLWQFTEKGKVAGITGNVDINIFNGSEAEFNLLTIY